MNETRSPQALLAEMAGQSPAERWHATLLVWRFAALNTLALALSIGHRLGRWLRVRRAMA